MRRRALLPLGERATDDRADALRSGTGWSTGTWLTPASGGPSDLLRIALIRIALVE